mmetsp:Transcript_9746/g.24245  ORF Transcript_9746/g.24245 Transcript_9746/m.24245 type:complete len:686 (+) Transcript_9746:1167-3224(+)
MAAHAAGTVDADDMKPDSEEKMVVCTAPDTAPSPASVSHAAWASGTAAASRAATSVALAASASATSASAATMAWRTLSSPNMAMGLSASTPQDLVRGSVERARATSGGTPCASITSAAKAATLATDALSRSLPAGRVPTLAMARARLAAAGVPAPAATSAWVSAPAHCARSLRSHATRRSASMASALDVPASRSRTGMPPPWPMMAARQLGSVAVSGSSLSTSGSRSGSSRRSMSMSADVDAGLMARPISTNRSATTSSVLLAATAATASGALPPVEPAPPPLSLAALPCGGRLTTGALAAAYTTAAVLADVGGVGVSICFTAFLAAAAMGALPDVSMASSPASTSLRAASTAMAPSTMSTDSAPAAATCTRSWLAASPSRWHSAITPPAVRMSALYWPGAMSASISTASSVICWSRPNSEPGAGLAFWSLPPLPARVSSTGAGAAGAALAATACPLTILTSPTCATSAWITLASTMSLCVWGSWISTRSMAMACSRCSGGVVGLTMSRHSAAGSPVRMSAACVPGCRPCSGCTRLSTSASSQPLITASVPGSFTSATTLAAHSGSVSAYSTAPLCSLASAAPPGSRPAAATSGRSAAARCSTGRPVLTSLVSRSCTMGTGSTDADGSGAAGCAGVATTTVCPAAARAACASLGTSGSSMASSCARKNASTCLRAACAAASSPRR